MLKAERTLSIFKTHPRSLILFCIRLQYENDILCILGAAGTSRPALPRDPSTEILATDPFGETEVKELQAHGFTRQQVIAELRRFEGDKTQAMAALFAKSLKF